MQLREVSPQPLRCRAPCTCISQHQRLKILVQQYIELIESILSHDRGPSRQTSSFLVLREDVLSCDLQKQARRLPEWEDSLTISDCSVRMPLPVTLDCVRLSVVRLDRLDSTSRLMSDMREFCARDNDFNLVKFARWETPLSVMDPPQSSSDSS